MSYDDSFIITQILFDVKTLILKQVEYQIHQIIVKVVPYCYHPKDVLITLQY